MLDTYLWIAAGGALGTVGRFGLGIAVARLTGPSFPWGTLLINILGSFVIGLFAALTGVGGPLTGSPGIQTFVMVGLCGGFTTFSSFGLQTIELLRSRALLRASAYVVLSAALCFVATWIGLSL